MINSEKELISMICKRADIEAVVVEGYDGVGKGRVLNLLSEALGVIPYRPDYNLWQQFDHRACDRWKISGFFWDVYSHFLHNTVRTAPMLFDRGVISGAVYNRDITIAKNYMELLRDAQVLHILVVCDFEDFKGFQLSRNPSISFDEISHLWEEYNEYTKEYMNCLDVASVSYEIYKNKYSTEYSKQSSETCIGCGHYNYGHCRHPLVNSRVSPEAPRCSYSIDKEVQDMEVAKDVDEMHCV